MSLCFATLVGTFLALCYLLTFPGAIAPHISDGRSMYLVTRALVDRLDVSITPTDPTEVAVAPGWHAVPLPPSAPCAASVERDVNGIGELPGGPYFSKYGIGQSLAAVPLYWLGTQVARLAPTLDRPEVAAFVTSFYCSLVTALTGALLCALALRLGWSRRVALALALIFGLATPIWAYTTTFFSEPTIGLCLLGALAAMLWPAGDISARAALVAGCWLGFAILVRIDSGFYVPVFAVYLLIHCQRRDWPARAAAFAVPIALTLALIGAYNQARFGSVLTSGYGIIGDHHDLQPPHSLQALWEGIYGPLFSPGKGLFLYAPSLLLLPWALPRFARIRRGVAWLIVVIVAVAILAHANTLVVWLGGWAWGPRFLIPVIPLLVLPLGSLLQGGGLPIRTIAWLLGMLGLAIQIPAVILDKGVYIRYLRDNAFGHPVCIWHVEDLYKWHPEYTPLIGQWRRLLDRQTYQPPSARDLTPLAVGERGRLVPTPQAWWSLLAAQGASHTALALAVLGMLILVLITLLLVLRAATPQSAYLSEGNRDRGPPWRAMVRY